MDFDKKQKMVALVQQLGWTDMTSDDALASATALGDPDLVALLEDVTASAKAGTERVRQYLATRSEGSVG